MNNPLIVIVLVIIIIYIYFNTQCPKKNKKSNKINPSNYNPAIHNPAAL
jgi:hypothetical protein